MTLTNRSRDVAATFRIRVVSNTHHNLHYVVTEAIAVYVNKYFGHASTVRVRVHTHVIDSNGLPNTETGLGQYVMRNARRQTTPPPPPLLNG